MRIGARFTLAAICVAALVALLPTRTDAALPITIVGLGLAAIARQRNFPQLGLVAVLAVAIFGAGDIVVRSVYEPWDLVVAGAVAIAVLFLVDLFLTQRQMVARTPLMPGWRPVAASLVVVSLVFLLLRAWELGASYLRGPRALDVMILAAAAATAILVAVHGFDEEDAGHDG